MKTKFIKENIVILLCFILISILGIFFFGKIGFQHFKYIPLENPQKGLEIIGVTIFITLVAERALEMLMNLWREPGKTIYKSQLADYDVKIKQFLFQIKCIDDEIDANSFGEKDLEEKNGIKARKEHRIEEFEKKKEVIQGQLQGYGLVTQQYAHLTSFFIGIFICLAGFGVLNEFFVYEEFEKTIAADQNQVTIVKESYAEFALLDSTLAMFANSDSILIIEDVNSSKSISNPLKNLKVVYLDSLLHDESLQTDFVKQKSNVLQYKIFVILNLLITALLISGGTDGMHKLANLYTTFLTSTTNTIKEADNLRNQK